MGRTVVQPVCTEQAGPWKSVSCQLQGRSHKQSQLPCQDWTCHMASHGVHVIALADGAGSAALSHFGAQRVVETICRYLCDHFNAILQCEDGAQVKIELLQILLEGLEQEARLQQCALSDLASTLLVAAVDSERFFLAHIGDGVIGYLDQGELKVASHPENGEFSNETVFVTSPQALPSMQLFKGWLKTIDGFVLFSDGTGQSLYHKTRHTLSPGILRLMHQTCLLSEPVMKQQLEEAFEAVVLPRTRDDISIAILARPSHDLPPFAQLNPPVRQQMYRLKGPDRRQRKQAARLDAILQAAQEPRTLKQIARTIHLKEKYARRHVEKLLELGLLEQKNHRFVCA